jgi:hypothetical protein
LRLVDSEAGLISRASYKTLQARAPFHHQFRNGPLPICFGAVKDVPTSPAVVPNDPKPALQDHDSLMIALTQRFSATLATIAEAAKRGDLSSEQAREMSAEQYQVTHLQFEQ